MNIIYTLPPAPKNNGPRGEAFYARAARQHAGRMKLDVAHNCLNVMRGMLPTQMDRSPLVIDPMVGAGTTLWAARDLGFQAQGWDSDLWCRELVDEGIERFPSPLVAWNAQYPTWADWDIMFTSPPFPNAHTQGRSKMQEQLRTKKSTWAGNELHRVSEWKYRYRFVPSLCRILEQALPFSSHQAVIGIHVKEWIRRQALEEPQDWVEEAATKVGLRTEGMLVIPHVYKSFFQTLQRRPNRLIVERRGGEVGLECGHWEPETSKTTKRRRCSQCPERDRPFVERELVVILRKE